MINAAEEEYPILYRFHVGRILAVLYLLFIYLFICHIVCNLSSESLIYIYVF